MSLLTRTIVKNRLLKCTGFSAPIDACTVLILAPHPDDEIIGMGGFILKSIQINNKIVLVFLTDGEASGAYNDTEEIKKNRRNLTSIIAAHAGISEENIYRMELADGSVPREGEAGFNEATEKLVTILEKEAPDHVFATHPLDFWPFDHVACAELAKAALKRSTKKSLLYYYWVWVWYHLKPWQVAKIDFSSYLRSDIKEELPQKKELIKLYIEPLAPGNKPWSGVLPLTLIKGNTQEFEVIEKINY